MNVRISSIVIRIMIVAILGLSSVAPVSAMPGESAPQLDASNQTPGWMTTDILDRLTVVGMSVLAPSYLPGAVSFLPSVDAYSGYYSFYWLVPGSPPTYLQVTGTVGGGIPAYSKYDRNVQLTQNASVLGYPAYQDLTPIYDLVYFQIGGVLYTVESNNIGDSSLGIANSLSWVDVPVYQTEPEPAPVDPAPGGGETAEQPTTVDNSTVSETAETVPGTPAIVIPETVISEELIVVGVQGVVWANLEATGGEFSLTGDTSIEGVEPSSFEWTAPRTQRGRTVRFTLTDPSTGDVVATQTIQVNPIPDDQIPVTATSLSCPVEIPMGTLAGIEIDGTGQLMIDASDGLFPNVGPNQTFAGGLTAEVPETDVLAGVIRTNRNAWVFFEAYVAPVPYTTYIFLQNWQGVTLLECGINIVFPDDAPTYADAGVQDGSGGVGGFGYGETASVPEGTNIHSVEFPGQGYRADGTVAFLAAIPYSDGTMIGETGAPDPATDPAASGTPASDEP